MILRRAGGVFRQIHDELVGVQIDFSALRAEQFSPELAERARAEWSLRVQTEYRSIQVMNRFLNEVLGGGDPLDVFAGAADAITDEIRHTALCAQVVEALGGTTQLPTPVFEPENAEFLSLSMPERALATGISMLAINETISSAYIEDLRERCGHPVIRAVLEATIADEDLHHAFGWAYVEASLGRFEASEVLPFARMVTQVSLRPHLEQSRIILDTMTPDQRRLNAWTEPELALLGLASPQRQALIFERVYFETLKPRLKALGLL